jgi:hypothetical protein
MTGAAWLWLWLDVIRPSWLSLVSAPFVLAGYWLIGRRRREGWWFVIASQTGLLAIGLADRQYGLLVVVVLIWQAVRNWRLWGRATGAAA